LAQQELGLGFTFFGEREHGMEGKPEAKRTHTYKRVASRIEEI